MQLVDRAMISLAQRKLKIAVAEATRCGDICHRFSQSRHAEKVMAGGITARGHIWERLEAASGLPRTGAQPGSPEAARAIAEAAAIFFDADIALAVIPAEIGGDSLPHPLFIHIVWGERHAARRFSFSGDREERILRTAEAAAAMVGNLLEETTTR